MKNKGMDNEPRIVAIDPTMRGFGYVVMNSPIELLDWGVPRPRTLRFRKAHICFDKLVTRYKPNVIVIVRQVRQNTGDTFADRLTDELAQKSAVLNIPCKRIYRNDIKKTFVHLEQRDKYAIAAHLASLFPVLSDILPAKRKAWETENSRINIFDALSGALVMYESHARTVMTLKKNNDTK